MLDLGFGDKRLALIHDGAYAGSSEKRPSVREKKSSSIALDLMRRLPTQRYVQLTVCIG